MTRRFGARERTEEQPFFSLALFILAGGSSMGNKDWDVIVIGGGVIGCAIARELARYDLKICVLEKEEDVCAGTSKANSAIIHAGYDAEPGSLKAQMNVEGNSRMEELSKELDFEFKRNPSTILEEVRTAITFARTTVLSLSKIT